MNGEENDVEEGVGESLEEPLRDASRGFSMGEVAALYDDSVGEAVFELTPQGTPDNVDLGLSVAINAMNDDNPEVAAISLRLAADILEGKDD